MNTETTGRHVSIEGSEPAGAASAEPTAASSAPPAALGFRLAAERGHADHGWLSSRHTFSFADYYDPRWMGFRTLRVINDDRVDAGEGFPTHGHRDMEILSYVLEGALQHQDSLGTGSVIRPGDVQRMSAGSGVRHSEHNASAHEQVHFLQIWIMPAERGITPGYEQRTFTEAEKQGRLALVASNDGRLGSVTVHADVAIHSGIFATGESTTFRVPEGRYGWLHVAKGSVNVGGKRLSAGDAAYTTDGQGGSLLIEGDGSGEVLVFDLP